MQILILSATPYEIKLFKNNYPNVDILITGVGTPATIYHLQNKLQQNKYSFVIQTGIGGAFSNKINLGETFLIKQDTFADLGAEEKETFTSFIQSGLINANEYPFINGWLQNPHTTLLKKSLLQWVDAVTINKLSDSALQKHQYIDLFKPQIESMEGAALHYVCLHKKIPFVQIRAVSNFVGERDKTKWQIEKAITNLNIELIKLIKLLSSKL